MTEPQIQSHYSGTVGRLDAGGANPLVYARVEAGCGRRLVDIHLGIRHDFVEDEKKRNDLKTAVRKYITPHLLAGEGMRCWLGVRGNPRINVWCLRAGAGFEVGFLNGKVVPLLEYWCKASGVDRV